MLYAALLWASRDDLRVGRATSLSLATTFLWDDYKRRAYLWEPLEMCRKLAVTGWHSSLMCALDPCIHHTVFFD